MNIQKKNNDVIVVSAERDIRRAANELNLKVIDRSEFTKLIKNSEKDETFLKKANNISRIQRSKFLREVFVSLLITFIFNFAYDNLERVVNTINIWGTISAIIVLSFSVYWFRGRYLFFYSLLEIFIGFTTSIRIFIPDFNYESLSEISFFQIIAGIYVVVRGLDNLGKSLKNTKYKFFWERFSGVEYKQ